MIFDIITIFPNIFQSYFSESIISRAKKKKLIRINIHNLRDYTSNRHKTVDDRPFSGGAGMVLKVEPIYKAVKYIKAIKRLSKKKSKIVLLSAKGKKFDQKMAQSLSHLSQLILICGRYEGVDERVARYIADQEISIGDYVLTGGELPAMVIVDALTRLIPGVIKEKSLLEESFGGARLRQVFGGQARLRQASAGAQFSYQIKDLEKIGEYPQYTRPAVFYPNPKNKKIAWKVPKILLSGDHKKIIEWRKKKMK